MTRIRVLIDYSDGSEWEVGSQEIPNDSWVVDSARMFLSGMQESIALGESCGGKIGGAPPATGSMFNRIFGWEYDINDWDVI